MRPLLPLLALALPLTACASPRVFATDDLTVLVAGDRSGGTEVQISGTLTDLDGCLGLALPGSAENRWVAVFPAGSEPAAEGRSVTLPDGSVLSVDDPIESAGETYGGGLGPRPDNTPSIPEECGDLGAALLTDPVPVE